MVESLQLQKQVIHVVNIVKQTFDCIRGFGKIN